MSDVSTAAEAPATPRNPPKDYGSMTKASAVADFEGSMAKNGLVLRVTRGELAAAAAELRGDKEFKGADTNKAPIVAALVILSKAVAQKQYDGTNVVKDAKGNDVLHKGAKGIDHLAENFGNKSQATRNLIFDPVVAAKVLKAVKGGDEPTVAALKTINEARYLSSNRDYAVKQAGKERSAKASGGAEIGG